MLKQSVSKRRFAVIDMSDYAKVSDVVHPLTTPYTYDTPFDASRNFV
jgi:hypothetical protein